mgnify:CR=1 FL=1
MGMYYGSMAHTASGRKKKVTRRKTKVYTRGVSTNSPQPYRREIPAYASAPCTAGVAARVDAPRYTGTLVKGIGTMHKSNAVPIINEQEMIDIARMRR